MTHSTSAVPFYANRHRTLTVRRVGHNEASDVCDSMSANKIRLADLRELTDQIPPDFTQKVLNNDDLFRLLLKNGIGLLTLDVEAILVEYMNNVTGFDQQAFMATKFRTGTDHKKVLCGFAVAYANNLLSKREKLKIGIRIVEDLILTEPQGQVLQCFVSNLNKETLGMWRHLSAYFDNELIIGFTPYQHLPQGYTLVTIERK